MGGEKNQRPGEKNMEVFQKKGGFRTMPFIIVNESFERLASTGLQPNMILYLINGYNMDTATGTSILFLWSAASNFLGIIGAFLSDSYLGRFRVIALGSISSLLGMILLWLTTMVPHAKPLPCTPSSNICESATPAQLALLYSSFGFMSIGAACIRPCSIAFGADQLIKKDDPKNEEVIQSFFNWYYASIGVSTILALTIVVYIQEQLGWEVGLGVPAILMFLSALFFFFGSTLYVKAKASKSLFTQLVQVFVVALKNRHLALPPNSSDGFYYQSKGSKLMAPTNKLRFLNKACIVTNPEEELNPDDSASKPLELCTVDQVEDLKALIRIIPIWSTGIMIFVTLTQGSISVLQANSMDRHIISNFQIPAASYMVFTIVTLSIWVAFYDRVLVPLLAKYTGQPGGLSSKTRMGIGLILSCLAMAVAALVEIVRRRTAIQEGLSENPTAVVNMSAMWLVPQHCLIGLAEAFNAVGQIEFYYSQLPKRMASIAMAFFLIGTAFSGLLGSLIVTIVDYVTSSGGKVSWVSGDLYKGHYDYYYWLLTILSFVNFLYYLVCCWVHGSSEEERSRVSDEKDSLKRGLLSEPMESPSTSST